MRPGTENVPGIVGLASAIRLAVADLPVESVKVGALRDQLEQGIHEGVRDVSLNGHRALRVPNIANISFAFIDGETLLLALDMRGIAVSTGSACNAGSTEPSHVLRAMRLDRDLAQGALRFSLGRQNTETEVAVVVDTAAEIVAQLREIAPDGQTAASCG